MKIKSIIAFAAITTSLFFSSCDKENTTANGVIYQIVDDKEGDLVERGGAVYAHIVFQNPMDTFDSRIENGGAPVPIQTPDSVFGKPSFYQGLLLLSDGDSAIFKISNDSLLDPRTPDTIKTKLAGTYTTYFVRITSVISKDSVEAINAQRMAERNAQIVKMQMQMQQDTSAIVAYLKSKKLKFERGMNGVYIVKRNKVDQSLIPYQPGETIDVEYTGRLLGTDKVFDSNAGTDRAFAFSLGEGQVIPGWEYAFMSLRKGEKATIYIPSSLAYGPRGAGPSIPPNSNLEFDVVGK